MELQATPARRGPKPNPHTRDNLLRAGVQMLHGAGYSATGIKEIVDAVKVPKGSFYNYFDSKEDFGRAVVDFYFDSTLDSLRALLTNEKVPPLERLHGYFDERIQGFVQGDYARGCLLGNMSLEVADHSAAIRERLAMHFKTWSGLFEDCIAEAQATGAIRNPQPASLLAQFLLNSWEGALLRMRAEKSDTSLKQFTEVTFGSLLV
ncbi:MAG: TetR family transcriptional regulator C-terminal domain-containing protein [Thiothrix sp.]|nr:TetR family transcriptional regulator C-terminal domain-containing protein [Thiothrix sp.]